MGESSEAVGLEWGGEDVQCARKFANATNLDHTRYTCDCVILGLETRGRVIFHQVVFCKVPCQLQTFVELLLSVSEWMACRTNVVDVQRVLGCPLGLDRFICQCWSMKGLDLGQVYHFLSMEIDILSFR